MNDLDMQALKIVNRLRDESIRAREEGRYADEYELLGRLNSFCERAGIE